MLPHARYHLFVYGTLRPGGRYHRKLCADPSPKALPAYVRGRLYHLAAGYPALAPGDQWVRGDILSFDHEDLMRAIDALEEYDPHGPPHANVYHRTPVDAYDADARLIATVETYRMPMKTIERMHGVWIPDGAWPEGLANLRH